MSAFSESGKLWGGRFSASTDELVEEFTASVDFDKRLAACDIDGSIAHVTMLARHPDPAPQAPNTDTR